MSCVVPSVNLAKYIIDLSFDKIDLDALTSMMSELLGYDQDTGTFVYDPSWFDSDAIAALLIESKGEIPDADTARTASMLSTSTVRINFETPDDEDFGKWSLNFEITPQGDIGSAVVSLDEGQVEFIKKPGETLTDLKIIEQYTGKYQIAGTEFEIILRDGKLTALGTTDDVLIPYKKNIFKIEKFNDMQVEFLKENGAVTGLKYKTPSGIYECKKIN